MFFFFANNKTVSQEKEVLFSFSQIYWLNRTSKDETDSTVSVLLSQCPASTPSSRPLTTDQWCSSALPDQCQRAAYLSSDKTYFPHYQI